MIIRAVFFLGLVLLLAPHEPDIGLGRPGAFLSASTAILSGLPHIEQACDSCSGISLPRISEFHPSMNLRLGGRSLSDVKAEIETAVRERRAARGS